MIDSYDTRVIPEGDLYGDLPLFGRYGAAPTDFDPAGKSPQEIFNMCRSDDEMTPDFPEGRTIYVIGHVIVKAAHKNGQSHEFGDANEAAAIALVAKNLPWIPVPEILFQGKVLNSCAA